jgi:hypothetical protein
VPRLAFFPLKALVWALGASGLSAAVVGALVVGCSQEGDAAAPGPGVDATTADMNAGDDSSDAAFYTICPPLDDAGVVSIDATFGSIEANLLQTVAGCINICHMSCPKGVTNCGAAVNGHLNFDLSLDASDIYAQLLGDGGGMPAYNEGGTAHILRVAPFDPDASLLYIKLNLHSGANPLYGSGMPQNSPGSVCPPAIAAVGQWIAQGATFDPHD